MDASQTSPVSNAASAFARHPTNFHADPWADAVIERILGPWDDIVEGQISTDMPTANDAKSLEAFCERWTPQWQKLNAVTQALGEWDDNATVQNWQPKNTQLPPNVIAALQEYLTVSQTLPDWADPVKIERAEKIFMEYGFLSVVLLFCASLPQCYVVPDLSSVLQATGQLIQHTDHRIRSTGAMVFPVMMRGGLTTPAGAGIAQILKVRLIHATVRHLILRQSPEQAMTQYEHNTLQTVAPLPGVHPQAQMFQALFAMGWDTNKKGLPCNQEELAYTLLTFSYVYLQGLRTLHVGLQPEDEEALLHAWNVAGHFLGIDHRLMANTMTQAQTMFEHIQQRNQEQQQRDPVTPDPRPALGKALIHSIQKAIPLRVLRPLPLLLTRKLCGTYASKSIGINRLRAGLLGHVVFAFTIGIARIINTFMRLFIPDFAIARVISRLLGYQMVCNLLMDQTRPLRLPIKVQQQMRETVDSWHTTKRTRANA